MNTTDYAFIPGFQPALQSSPPALQARDRLERTIEAGRLTTRQRARIALTVAHESGSTYCVWAQTCVARQAGLHWEDIVLAGAGSALGPRDRAIVRLAREITRTGTFSPADVMALSRDPLLESTDATDVAAVAALAVLDNYMIEGLAPARAHSRPQRAS